jgi:NAD(P)-dependent dehydrogenase (short-subunit alcohol dehydrogenase family)
MFDLNGKIVLVTGAASGIGEAIAVTMARQGAFVYVADLDVENGSRVTAEITAEGGNAEFLKLNVAENIECIQAAEKVHHARGNLDILVNMLVSATSAR